MKFTLEYPSEVPSAPADFLQPSIMRSVVTCAEAVGFSAVAVSEHPAPSIKWFRNGGHNTLDPIAALSFIAGATTRIKLMTNLYLLPLRSPYVSAKALSSLDILSSGRLIAGVGAGYLRSEFSAVGTDFDRRAELLDEALAALRSIWSSPETPVSGADFAAVSPTWLQPPTQSPHPPIWIGGNSKAARRRVVAHGNGWAPIIAPPEMASSMRSQTIADANEFERAVDELREQLVAAGRDPYSVDIQVYLPCIDITDGAAVQRLREQAQDLERRGATWANVQVDASTPRAAADYIEAFGDLVIGRV
jgi:probable F420-dependent oxidoreductase